MKQKVSRQTLWALVAVAVVSTWLRIGLPLFAIGNAGHDDFLFVRLAKEIGSGNWLGPYNNLTHAKGIIYSLFLDLNHLTGLPLKVGEHILLLVMAFACAILVGRIFRSRFLLFITFFLLAFNPVPWAPQLMRVVREGIYGSLAFGVIVFVFMELFTNDAVDFRIAVASGLIFGLFWLTREEGIWLAPSLCLLVTGAVLRTSRIFQGWKENNGTFRSLTMKCAIMVCGALVPILTVNSLNYFYYGVFRNNDYRSEAFLSAYGAVSRIKHDSWQRYVVFPRDAREKAYSVSPAALELRPYFEGDGGNTWAKVGCGYMQPEPCVEIHSGWFMWALRDAVASAGYYQSAPSSDGFYARLASEINDACDDGRISCGPLRSTMAPPFRAHYVTDALVVAKRLVGMLLTFGERWVGAPTSIGREANLKLFRLLANSRLLQKSESDKLIYGGWVFTENEKLISLKVERTDEHEKPKLITRVAPDVLAYFRAQQAQAIRFRIDPGCPDNVCKLVVESDSKTIISLPLTPALGKTGKTVNGIQVYFDLPDGPFWRTIISPRDTFIQVIMKTITGVYRYVIGPLSGFAAVVILAFFFLELVQKKIAGTTFLCMALLIVVVVRIFLLAYLDATSIPSVNMLYLSPAIPFWISLIPVAGGMIFTRIQNRKPENR